MATYTYSKTTNFVGLLSPPQLITEINDSIIVPICVNVVNNSQFPDVVDIIFIPGGESEDLESEVYTATLTEAEKLLLDAIVASHTPDDPLIYPDIHLKPGTSLLTADYGSDAVRLIGQQSDEIHISTETQGNYASVKAAVVDNPGPNKVFIIHPGIYTEDNPIVLAPGTVLCSAGNAENTFIVAANPTLDIIHCHIKCKLEGITFKGAYGAGARGLYFDASASGGYGAFTAVQQCFFKDCNIGMEADAKNIHLLGGVPDTLYARECLISPTSDLFALGIPALSKGIYAHSGGSFITVGMTMMGLPPTAIPTPALPILEGYVASGFGSKLAMTLTNCYFCGTALSLDDNASTELTLLTLKYCAIAIKVGSTGTATRLSVSSLEISDSVNYDLLILPTNAQIEVHSGILDDAKMYNPNGVRLNMKYHSIRNGQTRQRMLGIINIGSSAEPSSMLIGEGSYDRENKIFQNTNLEAGTWTDLTSDLNEETNTIDHNIFPGATVDNCIFLGRSKNICGIKINVVTATSSITYLESLEWTYWNGTSWVEFKVMQTKNEAPYYYVDTCFVSEVNTYHIRFGIKSNDPLVPKEINGVTTKWVRIRVKTALSSIPQTEYIKFHTNSVKINKDGFTEYFGDSRTIKKLNWDIHQFEHSNNNVSNQSLFYSKALNIQGSKNKFPSSLLSRLCLATFIPTDIDNSFPVKLKFAIIGDSATSGDVKFTFRYDFSSKDSAIYTDEANAPTNTSTEQTVSTLVNITAKDHEYRTEVSLDLDSIDANLYVGGPQMVWISIERDAGVGDDTYIGNISFIQLVPFYISWIDGGHLLGF